MSRKEDVRVGAGAQTRRPVCTIVGCKATSSKWTKDVARQAYTAGRMAAERGFVVLTGGHTGVMEHAAKGAKFVKGSTTVGILTTADHKDANDAIDIVIPSGMGIARNALTALAGDCMIAVPGGLGTLQEITYAVEYGRPVFSWASWVNLDLASRENFVHYGDHTDYSVLETWITELVRERNLDG